MLYKLSFHNFRAQFRNYFIYYLSMTFGVMMYYCFSAMTYHHPLVQRVDQTVQLSSSMAIASFFVVLILAVFTISANRFFLITRSQEIGLYQLFGMKKRQISLLFIMETLLIGLVSLASGLVLGMLLSRLFSMILLKVMKLSLTADFSISLAAMTQTSKAFLIILLLVSIRLTWLIHRHPLLLLFQKEDSSRMPKPVRLRTYVWGIVGIGLLSIGYYLAVNSYPIAVTTVDPPTTFFTLPFLILFLCILGTIFFFKYTFPLLLVLFSSNKKHYYRDLQMITVGSLRAKLYTTGGTMAAVAVFIGIALAAIGGGAAMFSIGMNSVDVTDPTDYFVAGEQFSEFKELLEASDASIESKVTTQLKLTGAQRVGRFGASLSQNIGLLNLVSLSNYNELRTINPFLEKITLNCPQSTVLLIATQNMFNGLYTYQPDIYLADGTKVTVQAISADYLGKRSLRYDKDTLIVSDAVFEAVSDALEFETISINVTAADSKELAEALEAQLSPTWDYSIYYDFSADQKKITGYLTTVPPAQPAPDQIQIERLNFSSRVYDYRTTRGQMGLLLYIVLFLGILVLIVTGTILALRQFSEAEQERKTYQLLKELGIPMSKIKRLVYQQNLVVFFAPMLIGLLHAFFAVTLFSNFVTNADYRLTYLSCGILVLLYVLFYFITAAHCYRIVSRP